MKRRRLGEPLATIPETRDEMMEDPVPIVHEDWKRERLTKKNSREPVDMSSSSGPKRMRMSCLHVSIAKSRAEHMKHLLETGAVKGWNREDAIKTGAKILSGKMVDDALKEKSRYCAREFATFKDPSMFAAASDVDNTCPIDLLAVKRGQGIMCFDAVAAFCHAPETELIFIEAPDEHGAVVGQHVLWQCLKVREGGRKGARAWQDHFIETLLSQDCPGSFKQSLKSPTIFYSSDFEAALDLHVDDGYMTGPAERMMEVFAYLEGVIVLKLSPIIGVGDSFEHVGALRVIDKEGMWVKELDKYETSVLTMMQMKDCHPSTSPKLEK